jgi:predicted permease
MMSEERRYRRFLRLRPQSREEVEREVEEEIDAHLAMRVEEYEARGESREQARADAVRRFGDYAHARRELVRTYREQHMRSRRAEWLDAVRRDVIYGWRRALHAPGYALFALATFALSIALATSTFTIVDAVLFRSLPFADPERLVALQSVGETGEPFSRVSAANWLDWQQQNRTLAGIAILQSGRISVQVRAQAMRAQITDVGGPFFSVLRTRFLWGRPFTEEELRNNARVVVVSEGFWRRAMGEDRALSERVTINGYPFTVTGVVRASDVYPRATEVWLPARYPMGNGAARNWINYAAIGRLADDVTVADADRDLDAIAARIRSADPVGIYSYGVGVLPLKDDLTADASTYLRLLLGAVAFVLLVACANLAGMNLARGVARKREMAVRLALGAGRSALIRQVLLEHLLLAVVGGLIGIAFTVFLVRATLQAAGSVLPRADEVTIDWRVLGVAAAITILAGLLTGLFPALRLSGTSLRQQMGGARGAVGGGRQTPGAVLVGIEIALALVLLTGGGLLLRSYRILIERPLGFDIRNVITAQIDLPYAPYREPARRILYWQSLEARLKALPGVSAAGSANWVPLGNGGISFIEIEGRADQNLGAGYRAVSDGYLQAIGVPLLAGRTFNATDDLGTQRVTVINQRMAEQFWPGQSPIGRRVRAVSMESVPDGPPPAWLTIVGVVGNVRHYGPDTDMRPEMYTSYRQIPFYASSMTAVIKTSGDANRLIPAVQAQLREVDPATPADFSTQRERLAALMRWRRLLMNVLSGFASVALLLAALGIYSLLSFAVAQRTREIAVRAALGARRSNLLGMVFRQALTVVLLGAAAGLLAAFALTRLMTALLVDVSPLDPVTFAGVTVFLLVVAGMAAALPALRATRLDPLVALRAE